MDDLWPVDGSTAAGILLLRRKRGVILLRVDVGEGWCAFVAIAVASWRISSRDVLFELVMLSADALASIIHRRIRATIFARVDVAD